MINKKNITIILLLFILTIIAFSKTSFAKYVIENVNTVAKLDIDRCKPKIELIDITTSNKDYPDYANKTHTITGHLKITEKNIIKNNLSTQNIKILVSNHYITPNFKSFSLISQNSTEKIYEFSFTNATSDGALVIFIPEGIIEDKSGLVNEQKYFSSRYIN